MNEDLVARAVLAAVMVGAGLLMLWMANAAASGRLGRNPVAGIRLASTMASDEAWLVAHRAAKRPTVIAGWCAIVSAIPALLPVPLSVAVTSVLVGTAALLGFVLYGAKVGSRAAQDLSPEG
ncbi:SdpI family protein [Arthrobacter echini]|uniref:SdpI family protein n=1 Tax=Arthrobacter echini TaxID=1529066 RepID=A0A4S5E7C3_9MICC|nr:SdpI family protein [Arthrobacter echini]THJ67454.1 SdpI family protein [Arthrobacter echini]